MKELGLMTFKVPSSWNVPYSVNILHYLYFKMQLLATMALPHFRQSLCHSESVYFSVHWVSDTVNCPTPVHCHVFLLNMNHSVLIPFTSVPCSHMPQGNLTLLPAPEMGLTGLKVIPFLLSMISSWMRCNPGQWDMKGNLRGAFGKKKFSLLIESSRGGNNLSFSSRSIWALLWWLEPL